ncbi:MAG: prolyl oligopeptidase family serine peptidase [Bacteroidaceae bacterium]|nr:prolyl oligopeptidase family serine peptidase [Bacteroidaceae bacterium]
MTKRLSTLLCLLTLVVSSTWAAKVNTEKSISVNGTARKYILYVPNNVKDNAPLVISLHGASGHDTDRSPFRTDVADSKGCIVVYPQGLNQNFGPFGTVPGWNATGEANEEIDFFKAIIDEVEKSYTIDRKRIYCCGFSNGGMMTYAAASAASDIFAACASISGFQLNEFHQRHTGYRPVPFLHIHGKADDFVKFSCTPIIRSNTSARNGASSVYKTSSVTNKYTKYEYAAEEGGFPYIFYAIDGMGHNDYTDKTPEGNSALTMWNFFNKYTLDSECDKTLKWRQNIDATRFNFSTNSWKVSADSTQFTYGTPKKDNNADNNVYPSLQFEAGNYILKFESTGTEGNKIHILVETLDGKNVLFSKKGEVGKPVVMPFSVSEYGEYKITITKDSKADKFTSLAIHSCDEPAENQNCTDESGSAEEKPEGGYLIEIPQDQGTKYDNFTRTQMSTADGVTTYTANGDLQVAFKMMDIDVTDCDYVIVKFAEPVPSGWCIAFWDGQDNVAIDAGVTEYKFELEPNMITTGKLPQICVLTLWGASKPLTLKVTGVYKHSTKEDPTALSNVSADAKSVASYFTLSGSRISAPAKGINIVRMNDGTTRKILVR